MSSVMSKPSSPSLSSIALSRMLVNGSICPLAPAPKLRHQRGHKLLFWRALYDMRCNPSSCMSEIMHHDGIRGAIEGERRKRLAQGTQIECYTMKSRNLGRTAAVVFKEGLSIPTAQARHIPN